MRIVHRQRWNLTARQAAIVQQRLSTRILKNLPSPLPRHPLIAGADLSYDKHSDRLFAGVLVLRLPDFQLVEKATAVDCARFPYLPGLLSFREAPSLLKCFRKLNCRPDVVMMDGHGLAHPRRFGVACHVGWILDVPTIGCGKSILVGQYHELGLRRGAMAPLMHGGETVGMAVRTREGVQPVFVSVGHRIDLAQAVNLVLRCAPRYRIPEPTRQAHILVNQLRCS